MSGRYSKLFSIDGPRYAEGAPVIVAAGALLCDNKKNQRLAQLKFTSVSEKNITAITVKVTPLDADGAVLGEAVVQPYVGLDVKHGESFGSQTPIFLPDNKTAKFVAAPVKAEFSDGSVWEDDDAEWELLKMPAASLAPPDPDTKQQFVMDYGTEYVSDYSEHKDIWFCLCGVANKDAQCHNCGILRHTAKEYDLETLEKNCSSRLAKERSLKEALEAIRQKKRKNIIKFSVIGAVVLIGIIVAFILKAHFSKCSIQGCEYEKLSGGDYCSVHTCKAPDCKEYAGSDVYVCEKHDPFNAFSKIAIKYNSSNKIELQVESKSVFDMDEVLVKMLINRKSGSAYENKTINVMLSGDQTDDNLTRGVERSFYIEIEDIESVSSIKITDIKVTYVNGDTEEYYYDKYFFK